MLLFFVVVCYCCFGITCYYYITHKMYIEIGTVVN